jgi:hypothetical protein
MKASLAPSNNRFLRNRRPAGAAVREVIAGGSEKRLRRARFRPEGHPPPLVRDSEQAETKSRQGEANESKPGLAA